MFRKLTLLTLTVLRLAGRKAESQMTVFDNGIRRYRIPNLPSKDTFFLISHIHSLCLCLRRETRAKALFVLFLLHGLVGMAEAQTTVFKNGPVRYRIPSIVRLADGRLMAFSDLRHGTGDIGNGYDTKMVIDMVAKTSSDNGKTWGARQTVLKANADATDHTCAYGDAATVVDRKSDAILMMNAAGMHGFFSGQEKLQVARSVSTDGGKSWTTSNVTNRLYTDSTRVGHLFFSSGRMIQSTKVKTGKYYRIYAGVNTRTTGVASATGSSRVVWSDDFGLTWHYLGGIAATPATNGDECKVEELPNGDILLSCRRRNGNGGLTGRDFNVFSFTDIKKAEGEWGSVATSGASDVSGQTLASPCDGEIMLVPARRTADGKRVYVLLQSATASSNHEKVSLYFKPLDANCLPADFVGGWGKFQVSPTFSRYSTMTLDRDGNVAVLYEENEADSGYDIVFKSLSLHEITGGAFSFSPSARREYHTTSEPK